MKQDGLVMVFALLVLMSITVLGVASVSSSLLQNKMASSLQTQTMAFDAAEAAIAGVIFESQDEILLNSPLLDDPLSDARQSVAIDLQNQQLSCLDDVTWTNRQVTSAGLVAGSQQTANGAYASRPPVDSWSRTAYVREQACRGSSNVIGGSHITCHVFIIKGCGQQQGSPLIVANSLTAAVFAPASQ